MTTPFDLYFKHIDNGELLGYIIPWIYINEILH